MEQLIKAVRELGDFTNEEITFLLGKIKAITCPKNDFLLTEGQLCQSIYFLKKGCLRHYYISDNGTENVLNLFVENDWVMDYQSFTGQKISTNNIQAFEDAQLLELTIWNLHELFACSPKYFLLGKLLQNVVHPAQLYGHFSTPEQKYREILINKPQLLEKFPLTFIASYLGIAPETLSRVRRRIQLQPH